MIAKLKKATKGFTLIELLVVIAIIGLLASIVLVSLTTARQKARDSRRIGDLRQIQLALELYFDANTTLGYPDSTNTGATFPLSPLSVPTQTIAGWPALTANLGTYMATVPSDPLDPGAAVAGRHYVYITSDAAAPDTQYLLGAALEDVANAALGNDLDGAAVALGARTLNCGATPEVAAAPNYCVRN